MSNYVRSRIANFRLKKHTLPAMAILFKGSRCLRMEQIVECMAEIE